MNSYSIKDLEFYSGIKAHTIRMWEKRYNLLDPCRTNTNIRTYTDDQLKRLLNIATLKSSGMKISDISQLTEEELSNQVMDLQYNFGHSDHHLAQINGLIQSMFNYDEDGINRIFASCVLQLGFRDTFIQIVYPLLSKIGYMWSADQIHPGHEHFISHIFRQKLMSAVDNLIVSSTTGKKFLLFLPNNEYHDLALLLANYLLREAGHQVLYLGQSTPVFSVNKTAQHWEADYLLFTNSCKASNEKLPNWMADLFSHNQERTILWAGKNLSQLQHDIPNNVQCVCCFKEFSNFCNHQSLQLSEKS